MLENQGIHINLTSDAGGFAAEMQRASQELFDFRTEAQGLKNDENVLRGTIADLSKEIAKKRKALDDAKNKLEQYGDTQRESSKETEKLKEKIKSLENEIAQSSEKLKANENYLSSNGKKQADLAGRILVSSKRVEELTNEYMQNTDSVRQNEAASKKLTGSLKSGALALKGIVLGYAGRTLYDVLIGSNAEFEQSITSFDVLLQSAEKAENMISNLDKFGAKTPFELEDLTAATEQLLAFGTAEEDVMMRLQQLGDLSKGNAQILERITLAYGKMQAKGKVSLEELNMLTEAGVPILKELANQMGITTDELFKRITAGEVSVEKVNAAMKAMTSEGGQFFGMMEKQSQTMEGQISTLSDNIRIAMRDMGEGAFDVVKQEISEILSELQQMSEDGSLKALSQNIGSYIAVAVSGLANFISILYNLRSVLVSVGGTMVLYKAMQKGAAIATTTAGVIKGYTTVIKLMNAAHKNGATGSTIFQAAMGKEQAIITTLTKAGYKDITVKKGMVTATNMATGATETLKIASLGLNAALGIVSAVISVAAMAFMSYKQKQDEARQATEEAAQSAEEEMNTLQGLVSEYKELRTSGDWDNSARERAREIQEEISKLVGKEIEGLDDVNGKLEDKIDILNKATYDEAYANVDKFKDAMDAAGKELWDKIYKNGKDLHIDIGGLTDNDEESMRILKMFQDEGGFDIWDATYINGVLDQGIDDFGEFMDIYPKLMRIKDKLANTNRTETDTYKSLCEIMSTYDELYEKYLSSAEKYMKNNAVKDISEYLMSNDINTQEAFDAYIEQIDNSGAYSEKYKEVLKEVANESFPQFSNAIQEASGEVQEQTTNLSGLVDKYKSLQGPIAALSSAQGELNKTGRISINSISEIKENFSALGPELDGYITRLVEANGNSSETEKIMSEMTDEVIRQTFSTEELANADVKLLAEELKQKGVLNAQETAQRLVNRAKVEAKLKTYDATTATKEETEELINYAAELGISAGALTDLIAKQTEFNNTELDVSSKITALESLSIAAGYAAQTLFGVTTSSQLMENAHYAYLEALSGGASTSEALAAKEKYIDDFYKKYTTEYSKNKKPIQTGKISFTPTNYDNSRTQGKEEEWEKLQEDREKAFRERFSNSKKWIEEQIAEGNFDAVYDGWGRITEYTDTFYATEKTKLENALNDGLIAVEEYKEKLSELTSNYGADQGEIQAGIKKSIDSDFDSYIKRAKKYIADRNFYGDWAQWGDTESEALARMFSKIDDYRAKGVSDSKWTEAFAELSKSIYTVEKEKMINAIKEEKDILKNKYEEELEMKKTAAEKELEVTTSKLEAEKKAINERADAEIEKLDELIQKRKEAREDEDYNLRMQRLQLELEYEHDEDNKKALQKEINKLQKEIEDTEFEREMERKRKAIEEGREDALEDIDIKIEEANKKAEWKTRRAEVEYDENISDENISEELKEIFSYESFYAIAESMGISFQDGIARGLQGLLSAFEKEMGGSGRYDYSNNSKTYKMYNTFSGAQSPADITKGLRKFLDMLELEGKS